MNEPLPPLGVLDAWMLRPTRVSPLGAGLINRTWLVEAPPESSPESAPARAMPTGTRAPGVARRVLQEVNAVFPPEINEDIDVVTTHLRAQGLVAPELIRTRDGKLWLDHHGQIFRLMTCIEGTSPDRVGDAALAREAGSLLARFHRALDPLEHRFHNPRLGVHDTARHLATLRTALEAQTEHPDYAAVRPLGESILTAAEALAPLPELPDRTVHGDPKINNFLFDSAGKAVCLIDFDTLGRMPVVHELGDAFRSWCNPAGEDDRQAAFSLPLFAAGIEGYAEGARHWITPAEQEAIVAATLTIYVELAARFCADALNERYFGWNPARFPSRSVHNQVRASSQLAAARSLGRQRGEAEAIVRRAFRSR